MEPIAVVGFSFKLPQNADDESSFWEVLEGRRNLMTEWPETRTNLESFYDADSDKQNVLYSRGAHFLGEDPAVFDAPFFSITAKEAAAMDPQHRWTLETSYRAFENAGMPIEKIKGSRTAVYSASMSDDYTRMYAKDPDDAPRTVITGTALSMMPNRVSWYFDLQGPSVHVDTACSSSMIALDLACQSLHGGDASMALVTSTNLVLGPEGSMLLANMNFLSPDSVCHSFDERANGYARGEGIIALLVKKLPDAIRDGDMIRAVVRATGSNQDGRTPGITQPSTEAQERMIRHVYQKAKLDLDETRYIEAHGTGTSIGDPTEVKAIGRVFRSKRSTKEPLYIGSIKANVGHLEGSSGLIGILKSIFILERGLIPPQALFDNLNPAIDAEFFNIKIPTECTLWPVKGLRRVSVNSFGFGGTNSHVILDDAYHYLQSHGLTGNHRTTIDPQLPGSVSSATTETSESTCSSSLDPLASCKVDTDLRDITTTAVEVRPSPDSASSASPSSTKIAWSPASSDDTNITSISNAEERLLNTPEERLLIWSAADEGSLKRMLESYDDYHKSHIAGNQWQLDRLAVTLSERRSHMAWRSCAVTARSSEDQSMHLNMSKPIRASTESEVAFIFTGQGAQYAGMGLDLLRFPVFEAAVQHAHDVFRSLGCEWSLFEEIHHGENIHSPEYSQPLCTALQLALVELLKSLGLRPAAVLGHSSGEIAAAYTFGGLSFDSACKVAFFRGQLAGKLKATTQTPGAMMSVNLSCDEIPDYLNKTDLAYSIHIACINSATNSTLSGTVEAISNLKERLDTDGIFAQKLNTGVAYHSPAMQAIASEYLVLMGQLDRGDPINHGISMVSSVTGKTISPQAVCSPQYWVDNMVSQVRFSEALTSLTNGASKLKFGIKSITDFVEVGPHGALRRPSRDILSRAKAELRYTTVLDRSIPPSKALLDFVGRMFCYGYPVSVAAVNRKDSTKQQIPFLVDCPAYPFDHSRKYWHESRLSSDYRMREPAPIVLGKPAHDWNPLEPRWRNRLSVESMPWIEDHTVNDTPVYPAAGTLVMAIEAVKQMVPGDRQVAGFYIKESHFLSPIIIRKGTSTETVLTLRPLQRPYEKESVWSDIRICARIDDRWSECFRATIQTQYQEPLTQVDGGREGQLREEKIRNQFQQAKAMCTKAINRETFYQYYEGHGLKYGSEFRLLDQISWDCMETTVAQVNASEPKHQISGLVHPAVLDAAIQALLPQTSDGMSESSPTALPHQVCDAWFSASGWQQPRTSSLQVFTTAPPRSNGSSVSGSLYALADNGTPLCAIKRLVLTQVLSHDATKDEEKKLLYRVSWKPQLSMQSPDELRQVCKADLHSKDESARVEFFKVLDNAIYAVMKQALAELTQTDRENASSHMQRYVSWMENQLQHQSGAQWEEASAEDLEMLLRRAETMVPRWRMFSTIARNLVPMVRGEVDPLEILFAAGTGQAEAFYADVFDSICDNRFDTFLDLATHENSELRILEVGAGTGGMTGHVLDALHRFEKATGSIRFSEYVYTDISPAFFEEARSRFNKFEDRLAFKTFDLERDASGQGIDIDAYDLVIAGSVIHATADLNATLLNIQRVLKPGGRLAFLEITAPEKISTNFGFGVVPGWWLGKEDWRQHSPLATEEQWDELLKRNNFSGNDLVLRDYPSEQCHLSSIMVSTAQDKFPNVTEEPRIFLVPLENSDRQNSFALPVCDCLDTSGQNPSAILPLSQLQDAELGAEDVAVCLPNIHKPFFQDLSQEAFQYLKDIMKNIPNLLWVTATDLWDDDYAYNNMLDGFLRTMRSEAIDKRIVSLAIEGDDKSPDTIAQHIRKVYHAAFKSINPELEYVVRNGQVTTGRLVRELAMNDKVRSLISPQLKSELWATGPALKLSVGTPGVLDTLQFVEDKIHDSELGPNEIEIEAKAWGLGFRDVFTALGRLPGDDFGYDCAGIVTRVGPSCNSDIQPGNRVCMATLGCMLTYPRSSQQSVIKIPDSLSFEAAASVISPGVTAYYSLVEVARLQKDEKILIHSASGATGQMAIWIAKMAGAEIFATVGLDSKKQLLMDQFNIPSDHIFYSRNTSFAAGIMRVTNGCGIDVVLNSLSGDGLQASWECVAPYGRFIEIGKADITSNSSLPMSGFAKNISFTAVDLYHVAQSRPQLAYRLLDKTISLVADGGIGYPSPLHVYSVSEIEKAFRYLQSGKNTGRIVISVSPSDVVPKLLRDRMDWKLDQHASYIVAGGLGGLGRAILRWMVGKGAKYLIVPSRSGAASLTAREIVAEMQGQGVQVVTPQCNAASESSLSAVLEECGKTMPPVKGCINAAMALQDSIFDNMTHSQWETTIQSKVQTSWNLHHLLPRGLDFFILLSSLSGVYGSIAQSNYAAGCTYQDALAHYRVCHGEKAFAFDIGWMRTIGIIAETEAYQRNRKNAADMGQIEEEELLALLDIHCDPSRPLPGSSVSESQLLIGAVTPADLIAANEPLPPLVQRPLFSAFTQVPGGKTKNADGSNSVDATTLFKQAESPEERAEVVVKALAAKLARALSISPDEIESRKSLSDYGVDSLMAVEMRNWIGKEFSVNVAVFDIMGGKPISAIGNFVTEKSEVGK